MSDSERRDTTTPEFPTTFLELSHNSDALFLICRYLDLPSIERLVRLSKQMTQHVEIDNLYCAIAVEWRGGAFWRRALTRKTHRKFTSMQKELCILYRFERKLAEYHVVWTDADYHKFWDYEEWGLSRHHPQSQLTTRV